MVERFLKASMKGWSEAVRNPEKAVQAYTAERPESDREFNEANFTQLIPILTSPDVEATGFGAQTAQRWANTQDILFDLGMIEAKVNIDQLFTNALR